MNINKNILKELANFIIPFKVVDIKELDTDNLIQYLAFAVYWNKKEYYQSIIDQLVYLKGGDPDLHKGEPTDGEEYQWVSYDRETMARTYYGFSIIHEPFEKPRLHTVSGDFQKHEIKRIIDIFYKSEDEDYYDYDYSD